MKDIILGRCFIRKYINEKIFNEILENMLNDVLCVFLSRNL